MCYVLFLESWVLDRFQTAKLTFTLTQGHVHGQHTIIETSVVLDPI